MVYRFPFIVLYGNIFIGIKFMQVWDVESSGPGITCKQHSNTASALSGNGRKGLSTFRGVLCDESPPGI